mmetsp:Transcript_17185/g.33694  ORF Transcript_17185/g.33694 Transcript_17185/m.33694 type:complete len:340 (+) Transcript_17185:44-1063(+)
MQALRGTGNAGESIARDRWSRWRRKHSVRATALLRDSTVLAQQEQSKIQVESLATRELSAILGDAGRDVIERHELEALVRKKIKTRAALERVLGSIDLYSNVLFYLETRDLNALAITSRECREAACQDLLWKNRALRMIGAQFIPRVTLEATRDEVLLMLQRAYMRSFFRRNTRVPCIPSHSWRSLLSDCRRLKSHRAGGFGSAVIVPRAEICPHHILGVVYLLSIRKNPACVAEIMNRFLSLYASLEGDLRLRDNVGFCFRVPLDANKQIMSKDQLIPPSKGAVESASHKDFMDVVLEANLQLRDLIAYYHATHGDSSRLVVLKGKAATSSSHSKDIF